MKLLFTFGWMFVLFTVTWYKPCTEEKSRDVLCAGADCAFNFFPCLRCQEQCILCKEYCLEIKEMSV